MVTNVEVLKAIVRDQDLRYLVVSAMDGSKIHQANGVGPEPCCKALDEAAALMGSDPFQVHAWFDKVEQGGKKPRLAKEFKWVVKLAPVGMAMVPGNDPRLFDAIQGIGARLETLQGRIDAMEDDDDDEPESAREPVWLGPLMMRVFPLVDRVLGLPPQAAINGASTIPDDEFVRAALRARADPQNAAFVDQLMGHYGDKSATTKPATDESAKP